MRAAAHPVQAPGRTRPGLLAAVLPLTLLAACGGGGTPGSSTTVASTTTVSTGSARLTTPATPAPSAAMTPTSPGPAATGALTGRTLQITVRGTQVSPPPGRFELAVGEQLTLTVTSDTANELHVHGWDVERELAPGEPATVELVGREAGTFEVETHDPELLLTKITVR